MDEQLITFGSEIKALGGGKVGGYLIRFSTAEDPDLTNDYFSKETNLHYPESLPVLYNHGLDKTLKKRVIGSAHVVAEDAGLWAESQLNLADEYEQEIYKLAEAGKLGYSSGALSHLVEREPAGKAMHIKSWFIGEVSITPTPAEPRNRVVSLKSLIAPEETALPTDGDETSTQQIPTGEIKMEENEVELKIAAALKARDEIEAKKAAELKALEDARAEGARVAVEELEKSGALKKSGYHNTNPTDDDNDGVGAFKAWMQTGQVNHSLIEAPGWYTKTSGVTNLGTAEEGGYAVPDPLLNRIIAKRDLSSWVRQAPCQVFQTESDHILIPVEDTRYTDFVSTAESATYNNDTTGDIAQINLALTKYTKHIPVTEEFLSARNSNWESWIADVLGRAEAGTENALATAVVLADATTGTAFASATAITVAELARCVGELSNGYAVPSEAGFLVKNGVKWYCLGLTGDSFAFLNTHQGPGMFGFPIYVSDDMEAQTTGLKSVVFGNWRYFGVVETPGMVIQRNPYDRMYKGEVSIYASIRRGYDTLQTEAVRSYAQA